MNQLIYKNGCWGCKRAIESESLKEQYICPKLEPHWKEYKELKKYE